MAPEVVRQTGAGRQADIWSVGCTIIEMATGKPPFSQFEAPVSALFHIAVTHKPPVFPDCLSDTAHDFLRLCFMKNPRDRPNAHTLLQHPFITSSFLAAPSVRNMRSTKLTLSVNVDNSSSDEDNGGGRNGDLGVVTTRQRSNTTPTQNHSSDNHYGSGGGGGGGGGGGWGGGGGGGGGWGGGSGGGGGRW